MSSVQILQCPQICESKRPSVVPNRGFLGDWLLYTSSAGRCAVFDNSAAAVYKNLVLKDPEYYTPLALNCQKGQHLPALEVYTNRSPESSHMLPANWAHNRL